MRQRVFDRVALVVFAGFLSAWIAACTSHSTPPTSTAPLPEPSSAARLGNADVLATVSWNGSSPTPVEDIVSLLDGAGVASVVVPTADGSWPTGFRVSVQRADFDPGPEERVTVTTIVRSDDGALFASITVLPRPVCGHAEQVIEVRGGPGCVVQSQGVTMLEWEEVGVGFRIESYETVESLVELIDQGLVAIVVE